MKKITSDRSAGSRAWKHTRIFLHEHSKRFRFQYRLRSASALSPIENELETRSNQKQHKTTLTCPTKQHLTNKHFITAFCWLNWTPMQSRCTAGILKPRSRDQFAVFVQQWQQGHEEVHASGQTDVKKKKKKIASTPTDVWIYFCLHTPSVLHESAHMEHCSQKQI